jgi:hypothetical protein
LDLVAIAKSVLARRSDAVFVPFRRVTITGHKDEPDWHPQPKFCHDNVTVWVERNPQHKHIPGYVIFDLRSVLGGWQVQAHSVVELEDGTLIDITPSEVSGTYPFVRHSGTVEEFVAMMLAMRVDVHPNDK